MPNLEAAPMARYPEMRLGFTTANFALPLPASLANGKAMVDAAVDLDFSFIELRDPDGKLTREECAGIGAYARGKNVGVIYAVNTGALDSGYFSVFERAIANADQFDGPRFMRTGANGDELKADPEKRFWNGTEFSALVANLDRAGAVAAKHGITLSVENAREGLIGDGTSSFGWRELFGPSGVGDDVAWQLDVANFFCTSKAVNDPEAIVSFLKDNAHRVGYSHFKSSLAGVAQPVLRGNDLDFSVFLEALSEKGKNYIALELKGADSLEVCLSNHRESLSYLAGSCS